jgi:RND family efflux transporter MFP subunit
MKLKRTLIAATVSVALAGAVVIARGVSAPSAPAKGPAKPALTVTADAPRHEQLPLALAANGNVAAWQEASVGAEAHNLRLATVHVNVGDVVRRGQVLATFAPQTTQAELARLDAAAAEAQAGAAEAAANAERARSLQATGALSAQQIQQYLTAEQTAAARVVAQRAAVQAQKLKLAQTQVLAPDDGVISARSATVGAVVPAGHELFRLIRGGRLEWRAELTSAELVQLPVGSTAKVIAADGSIVAGRVRMVAPTVDPQTRLGLVYVDLDASPRLKAGMYAKGTFELGGSAALTVPQRALVVRDGHSYLFALQADGRVRQLKVQTGRRVGDRVELLDGVETGTRFVAAGAGFLNDGDVVKESAARSATPLM